MRLSCSPVAPWPPLAWLACLHSGDPRIEVFHGRRVEVRDDWFCEAVWAGDFAAGDFDRTDLVVGSGGRLRDGEMVFVSSGNTVDRLLWIRDGERIWLSNSLPCLLAAVDATVDPTYRHYFHDMRSILRGLHRYRRTLASSRGPVRLTFFANLRWDGRELVEQPKPEGEHPLRTYADYRDLLTSTMAALAGNMAAPGRGHPYRMIGALSSGYDSTAATALASRFGCAEALCVDRSREGEDDSGAPSAPALGVAPLHVPSDAWRTAELPEVPFIAANACGEEVYLQGAEPHLAGKVLVSGYFGDQVWGKDTEDLSPNMVWGGHGLALAEWRLQVGFLHCPVAFWGVRRLREICAISNAEEMRPWDIPGPYSRPICRRLAEEAGVPRELFGQRKRAASVLLHCNEFLTPASLADYLSWLRGQRREWLRRRRLPPLLDPSFDRRLRSAANALHLAVRTAGFRAASMRLLSPLHLRRYVFPWAVERMKGLYPRPGSPPA